MPQIELKPLPPAEAVAFFSGNGFAVSINQHGLLSFSDARGLVASVLAVVERAVEAGITPAAETAAQGRGQPRSTRPAAAHRQRTDRDPGRRRGRRSQD